MLINSLLLIVWFVPAFAAGQSSDPCYADMVQKLKSLDVAEARKVLYKGECKFRFKDEFGEDQRADKQSVERLIASVNNYKESCEKVKAKPVPTEADLKAVSWSCGSGAQNYTDLEQAEKATGVQITSLAKDWDKFVADTKGMWAKEEAEEKAAEKRSIADAKAEAESPAGIAKDACYAHAIVERAKSSIAEEQEIGKHSGVVDKHRLHEAGSFQINYTKALERAKSEYRAKAGKEWTPSLCKGRE